MAELTADDALNLGNSLLDAHDVIHNYYMDNWNALAQADRDRLESQAISLHQKASDLITQGVGIVIDDLSASVAGLVSVTNKVEQAIQKIKDVKKMIDITAALVDLAVAIPSHDAGAIVSAGKTLIDAAGIKASLTKG